MTAIEKGVALALDAVHQAHRPTPAAWRHGPGDLTAWLIAHKGERVRVWIGATHVVGTLGKVEDGEWLWVGNVGATFARVHLATITEAQVTA